MSLLISTGHLGPECLANKVAIVTGGGRGIGLEASRALLWLGARVVIAEIDLQAASAAASELANDWGADRVLAVPTDVADDAAVVRLLETTLSAFGAVDAVLNNATAAPTGDAVWETAIADWDRSYAVNLRGPALLARACLPGMIERGSGVFACVSSAGGPYQAAYESLKAAQIALSSALDAELSGTGVVAFTIGPGLVPTATAVAAVQRLLPRLGLSGAEFLELTRSTRISVEAAGAGFAAAIAMADRYAGQEISSTQALADAGITLPELPVPFPLPGGDTVAPAPAPIPDSIAVPDLALRCGRVRRFDDRFADDRTLPDLVIEFELDGESDALLRVVPRDVEQDRAGSQHRSAIVGDLRQISAFGLVHRLRIVCLDGTEMSVGGRPNARLAWWISFRPGSVAPTGGAAARSSRTA